MQLRINKHLHRIQRPSLRHINVALFVVIILLDSYIAAAPLLPTVVARPRTLNATQAQNFVATHKASNVPAAPQPNQLIIPAMQLDQPIYEGTDTYAELDKGVWHWPGSSTPDKGSNTVLLGHRFTYTTPRGVFYFLDVVKVGDEISIEWNNILYTYRVYQTEVVTPDHVEILDPTAEPTLTIYTCTPTWWPVNRLVVKAHLERQG